MRIKKLRVQNTKTIHQNLLIQKNNKKLIRLQKLNKRKIIKSIKMLNRTLIIL